MKALNFFVAQPSTFATSLPGSAKTTIISTGMRCVAAFISVATIPTKETAVSW